MASAVSGCEIVRGEESVCVCVGGRKKNKIKTSEGIKGRGSRQDLKKRRCSVGGERFSSRAFSGATMGEADKRRHEGRNKGKRAAR